MQSPLASAQAQIAEKPARKFAATIAEKATPTIKEPARTFRVTVLVLHRAGCSDPNETATLEKLHSRPLRSRRIQGIKMGKCFILLMKAASKSKAIKTAISACQKMLARSVAEGFEIAKVE